MLALGNVASSPCSPCSAFASARLRVAPVACLPTAALASHEISWAMGRRMPPAGAFELRMVMYFRIAMSFVIQISKIGRDAFLSGERS